MSPVDVATATADPATADPGEVEAPEVLELLEQLRQRGVRLFLDDGKLRFRAPKGALTAELKQALKARRDAVIEWLREVQGDGGGESSGPSLEPMDRSAHGDDLPLSFSQERLWFLEQWALGDGGTQTGDGTADDGTAASTSYNITDVVSLRGALDADLLERALAEIVDRHEVLRSTYHGVDGRGVQRFAPPRSEAEAWVELERIDLASTPQVEAEAQRRAQDLSVEPFDLRTGPLVRVQLLRLAAEHHWLLISMHHIVSDGWSTGVLIRELGTLYGAFVEGRPSPLPPLPIQYVDFAHWQRQWLDSPAMQTQLEHWKKHLAGAEGVLELPTDRPRPAQQRFHGRTLRATLPPHVSAGLDALLDTSTPGQGAVQRGTTRFMVLLAAWGILLGRYAGAPDVLIGTPVANRRRAELEGLIGFFVNTLVLRLDLRHDPPVTDFLRAVRRATLDAFTHQDLPFERLVEELQPERDPSRNPLFQAMLVVQNAPMPALRAKDLVLEPVALENTASKFDLTWTVVEAAPGDTGPLAMELEYNTDLFDPSTAERLVRHLTLLLGGLVDDPSQRLSRLPLLTPAESTQLRLGGWVEAPVEGSLAHTLIEARAAARPDALAAWDESGGRLTFGELDRRANALAHHLVELGVGPETLVGLALPRSFDLLVALLAVWKAGGAYVPLEASYPDARLRYLLDDAAVSRVLTTEAFLDARPLLAEEGRQVICLDGPGLDGPDLDGPGLDLGSPSATADRPPAVALDPANTAYVIYTSGSTGKPKGVLIHHRGLVDYLEWCQRAYGLDRAAAERDAAGSVVHSPLGFDLTVTGLLAPLAAGLPVGLVAADGGLEPLAEALRAAPHLAVLKITPAHLEGLGRLLAHDELAAVADTLVIGGEALRWETLAPWLEHAPASRFVNEYGPTETVVGCSVRTVRHGDRVQPLDGGVVPIGGPVDNTRLWVVDRHGGLTPPGAAGELWIGGLGVARGYLARPRLTAERFVPDPFSGEPGARLYRSGDRVRWPWIVEGSADEGSGEGSGELLFLGRFDDQVKVRGYRIELGEIEAALGTFPGATGSAVRVRDGGSAGPQLVGYVELPGAAEPSESPRDVGREVRAHLAEQLPEYMVPTFVVAVDALPLTAHGKVDRRALAAFDPGPAVTAGQDAARTATEEVLVEIWRDVLGVAELGIHGNFFELGGHSLLATQIVARMEAAFGLAVPLRKLFEAPTVAGLAESIDLALATGGQAAPPPIEPLPRDKPLPLSFGQERLWLFEQLQPGTPVYTTCRAGHLRGPLDLPALDATFDALLERHEILRTRYTSGPDGPVQLVEPHRPGPLPRIDLSALPAERREAEALRLGHREHNTPLPLDRTPLARASVLRFGPEEHVVLLSIHHICYDLWSGGILLAEIEQLYLAFVARRPSPLVPLTLQYADFAAWQRGWLQGAVLDEQLDYWRQHLAGVASSPMELASDRPRPAVTSHRGTSLRFELPADLSDGMRQLGRRASATQFMTHLALYEVLLWRLVRQDRLLVGSAVSNRGAAELEDLMGFFDNLMVLATDTHDAQTLDFPAFLERVRQVALGAYAHQHLPFEVLVQELGLEGGPGSADLVRTVFLFELNYPAMTRELAGLTMVPYQLHLETSKFDLTFSLREGPEGLLGQVEFNTDLFDETTILRLVKHYEVLLRGVLEHPDRRLADLPLLTSAEHHQLLTEWAIPTPSPSRREAIPSPEDGARLSERGVAGGGSEFRASARREPGMVAGPCADPRTIPERLATVIAQTPDAIALVDDNGPWTYAALDAASTALACRLRHLGVGPEVPVGVLLGRSAPWLVALHAAWKTGGAYLPIDPDYPPARIAFMLEDSGAPVLVTEPALASGVGELPSGITVVDITAMDITAVDGMTVDDMTVDGITIDGTTTDGAGSTADVSSPDSHALAYVIYTSGSTGRPKGVSITHGTLAALVDWHVDAFGLTADDHTTQLAGLAFDASVWEVWPTLSVGACLHFGDDTVRRDPEALRDWLLGRCITVSFLPTPLAEATLALPWPDDAPLRWMLTGGDRLHRPPRPSLPFRLSNNYGPTENTVVATSLPVEPSLGGAAPSIGRPIGASTAHVADPFLRPLPAGVAGELSIGGQQLARGYLGRPALTAERFVPDPWSQEPGARLYRSGDRVRWTPDGTLDFLGRIDHQVKVRGFRVELGEIEACLRALPEVTAAAVVAPQGADGSQTLVGFVVPSATGRSDDAGANDTAANDTGLDGTALDDLRRALGVSLPEYMVPAALVSVDALPLTAHGKVDRRALEQRAPEVGAADTYVAPRTPLEERVAAIWQGLLDRRIGVHDDFFALGGHSLLATRLATRLRQSFAVEVPLDVIFDRSTVAGLAAWLETATVDDGSATALPPVVPVDRGAPLALSFAQERMWFLDQLQGQDAAYTIPAAVRLHGDLDSEALRRGLDTLVARHESLRTTFTADEGRPWQVIAPPGEGTVDFETLDLTGEATDDALRRALVVELQRPFDLARGPLFRARLVALGSEEHVLFLALHHSIADGWSMGVVVAELAELYAAETEGRSPGLEPLAVQYADFAAAQRNWLADEEGGLARQVAFWREQLADVPVLDLPADGPPTASSRGARHLHGLPDDLAAAVRRLGERHGASPFMALGAALSVLLHRLTGAFDLTLGYPIAGRRHGESEGLIGVFLNTLVLRVDLSGEPTFEHVLHRVRRAALEAYAHQDVPFEKLLEELRPERDTNRTPFFQVFFNMLAFPPAPDRLGDLRLEALDLGDSPSKFDLSVYATDHAETEDGDGGLSFDWTYKADRFAAPRIAAMAEQLTAILTQVTARPTVPVAEIRLASPSLDSVLPDPRSTLRSRWRGSVVERLAAVATESPDRLAVTDIQGSWTYGELDTLSRTVASALVDAGLRRGDVVAVHASRSAALPGALWGVLRAGLAFAILDAAYPPQRLALQVDGAKPRALLNLAVADGQLPPTVETALGACDLTIRLVLPTTPTEPLTTADGRAVAAEGSTVDDAALDADDLAYVAFTSGTTGRPRVVEGTHGPLAHFFDWHAETFELTAGDRFSMLSGLAHDPLLRDVFTPLSLGASLHVPSPDLLLEPAALRSWMAEQGITVTHLTPPLARVLAHSEGEDLLGLPSLRYAFLGGAELRGSDGVALRRLAPTVALVNVYGATETPQVIAYHPVPTDHPADAPVPIGRGVEGAQLLVLNAAGVLAGIGERGELCVRSPHLARGYRDDDLASAQRFNIFEGERLYRTGDAGRYDPDGAVHFLGRLDDQLEIRGYRVEPAEVEQALLRHPAVAETAVVLASNGGAAADTEGRLTAWYVMDGATSDSMTADEALPTSQALRDFLAESLPVHMVPAAYVCLDTLPLTPNGKVDRRALSTWVALGDDAPSKKWVAPRDEVELALVEIWRGLLGVESLGVRDDFFAVGGHSLLAVRLVSRIRQRFGVDLPLEALFRQPTVEGQARWLRSDQALQALGPDDVVVPMRDGSGGPIVCVHPIGGDVLCYGEFVHHLSVGRPVVGLRSRREPPADLSLKSMAEHYLAELLGQYPEGPYLFVGWSMGGVIAQEMARQLAESGGPEVDALHLIDSTVPEVRDLPNDRELLLAFAADLAGLVDLDLVSDAAELDPLDDEALVEHLSQLARQSGAFPEDLSTADLLAAAERFKANARALVQHRPGGVAVHTQLVRASEPPRRPEDLGWSGHVKSLNVHTVEGDHHSLLRGDRARELASLVDGSVLADRRIS